MHPKNKDNINHTTYYWFKNGFNDEEIKKIKDYVKNIEFQKGTIFNQQNNGYSRSIRDSEIKWIKYNEKHNGYMIKYIIMQILRIIKYINLNYIMH